MRIHARILVVFVVALIAIISPPVRANNTSMPGSVAASGTAKANPETADCYSRRAKEFEINNDCKNAAADAAKAFALDPSRAVELTAHVNFLRDHKQFDLALGLTNRALAVSPRSEGLLALRAFVYQDLKQSGEALKDLDAALKLAPKDDLLWQMRAQCCCTLGQFTQGISDVNHAIDLNAKKPDLLWIRGALFSNLGKKDQALASYQAACRADPTNIDFRCSYEEAKLELDPHANGDQVIQVITAAIKRRPQQASSYYWRAKAFDRNKDYKDEAADVAQAFELDASSIVDLKCHLNLLCLHKQFNLALNVVTRALEKQPHSAELYALRAKVYSEHNQVSLAVKDIQTALRIDAANFDAHQLSANISQFQMMDLDKALTEYTLCLQAEPDNFEALRGRGDVLQEMGRPQEGLRDLQHAHALNPQNTSGLGDLASCQCAVHNEKEAERLFRQCIALGNSNDRSFARFGLAKMLMHEKRYSEAIAFYEDANKEHPQTDACERIYKCYMELKMWSKAIDAVSNAIKISPKESELYVRRAEAFVQARNYQRAIDDYTTAIAMEKYRDAAPRLLSARAHLYEELGRMDLATKDRKSATDYAKDMLN